MKIKKNDSIFRNKDFMLLWFGQWVSFLGNRMHSLAVMWYVLEKTGSTLQMGTTLVFTQLPMIILSPITGSLADRWDRKKIIVLSDLINGTLVAIISLLTYTDNMQLWMLYLISALMSSAHAFFSPAITAAKTSIVKKDNLIKANSLTQFTVYSTNIFGPAIGGILISIMGISGLFLINCISYIFSGISESFIRIPKVERSNTTETTIKEDIMEGIKYAIKNKELLHFIIVGGLIINLFLAPLNMMITYYSKEILEMGSEGTGVLLSALGIGGVLMSVLTPIINRKISYYTLTFIGLTCEGLCLILFGMSYSYLSVLIALVSMGACLGVCNISLNTVIQTLIPNHMMGRVESSIGVITQVTIPLGVFLGGLVLEIYPVSSVTLISGLIVSISGFTTINTIRRNTSSHGVNNL